jgi:hypothetical protein
LRVALAHKVAALRPARVRPVRPRGADELAHLLKSRSIEPAFVSAAANGVAIGFVLVGTDEFVAAFMTVDPELHGRRYFLNIRHVENDELPIRRRGIVVEIGVEHGRIAAANHTVPFEDKLTIGNHGGAAPVSLDSRKVSDHVSILAP